ncbi:crotonyl-CoA carboxylase/reductase, partial [Streptomyces sp. NPDC048594]
MREIREAILASAADGPLTARAAAALPLPEAYRAVVLRREDTEMFAGIDSADKDPRKSLHLAHVPVPELGPGEALVAVMASSVNYNTVWSSIFEPLSTFGFLERYGRTSDLAKRHDLPYHI